ncbi:CRE-HER-1 protein [Caenorhabditis remanei]|uniref:CRE-HER-1 protein n=1 Tax=Caenorhabditis remanei TaxID=31234 RepID=E3M9V5_CAERE|nr:CRE-HER-1 protein [Caenorhabditis remanei]
MNPILIFLVAGSLAASFTDEKIEAAAAKCCVKKEECCREVIRFGLPVRCRYEKEKELPRIVYNCLQKELFDKEEEKHQRVELDDIVCCQVFLKDKFDPKGRCERICKTAMESPSYSETVKLQRIKECTIVENPRFQCFNQCRALRREGINIEVMRQDEYCNTTTTHPQLQKKMFLRRRWL